MYLVFCKCCFYNVDGVEIGSFQAIGIAKLKLSGGQLLQ